MVCLTLAFLYMACLAAADNRDISSELTTAGRSLLQGNGGNGGSGGTGGSSGAGGTPGQGGASGAGGSAGGGGTPGNPGTAGTPGGLIVENTQPAAVGSKSATSSSSKLYLLLPVAVVIIGLVGYALRT